MRRDPSQSVVNRLLRGHLETFLARFVGLCPVTLAQLPMLPVIVALPSRVLAGPTKVELAVDGADPLVGLEMRTDDRDARRVAFDEPLAPPARASSRATEST